MIEICTIGGFSQVGKNMTAVKVDDEVIILDMGLDLDNYIAYTEDEDIHDISAAELLKVEAIPDDSVIKSWRKDVKAIVPTHAHLDHVGAVPFLASKYDAPIVGTPFTIEVIKTICRDDHKKLKNKLKVINPNSSLKISENITIEFINITHSTPQTVMVAIHTPYGIVLYANDFKFDHHPILGKKPNFKRLKELGKENVVVLIVDSIYAGLARKTPSEKVAQEMLRDVLLGTESEGKAVIVTTFSSHLARLKSIIEMGHKLGRKVVFLGRSLAKYTEAGEKVGIINFSKEVEIVKYGNKVKKMLKKLKRDGMEKYMLVVTGHQGEPKAVLSKMTRNDFEFKFNHGDKVIFSCTVIPNSVNVANRMHLEEKLKDSGVRIFTDIHQSGHASKEDLRDLINMVKPRHIIPAHGELQMSSAMAQLAKEEGYETGKNVHIMLNGQKIELE